MARPDRLPFFATLSENDPTYGTPNKAIPSQEKQDYGQRAKENTLRQDINWLFDNIRSWLQFFDEQYLVGTVYDISETGFNLLGTNEVDRLTALTEKLGGSWDWIASDQASSTDTLAGVNTVFVEKTA